MKTATVLRVGDGGKNQKKDRNFSMPEIISFRTITGLIGVQILSSPRRPRNARVVAGLRHILLIYLNESAQ
jgi:hypothetical protein